MQWSNFAVIFDFDGLIVDSETPEFEAHRQIFAEHGVTLSPDEWRHEVGTWLPGRNRFERLAAHLGRPLDCAALREEKRRRFWTVVNMEPLPGVRRLLDELHAAGTPMAIASSSESTWILPATARLDVKRYFRTIITGDDVQNRKPHPEPYLLAASKLGVEARHCVVLEDSSHGIVSAKAAGMKAVAIPNWLTCEQELSAADLKVESALELTAEILAKLVGSNGIK